MNVFYGNKSFVRKLYYLKRTSVVKNYRLSTYAGLVTKFSICSVQSRFYLGVRRPWQMQANAAAFQPFLLSILALPLHIEISAKQSKLLFLVTYGIQAAPKFDFFLEDFDSCQNQT